jgi:tartrate dehydrogenase/decarboxylase/D-malate dehydrogenase
MTTNHRIALIPSGGIGTEVLRPAQQVLDVLGRRHGFCLSYTSYDDWSCERYLREGAMMPVDGIDTLRDKVWQYPCPQPPPRPNPPNGPGTDSSNGS